MHRHSPGDVLAIHPRNSSEAVSAFIESLGLTSHQRVHLSRNTTSVYPPCRSIYPGDQQSLYSLAYQHSDTQHSRSPSSTSSSTGELAQLKALRLTAPTIDLHLPDECTAQELFEWHLDIFSTPKKYFFEVPLLQSCCW